MTERDSAALSASAHLPADDATSIDVHTRQAVTVSLADLKKSTVSLDTLEAAFGPSSLGILVVKDLPANFVNLRERVLSSASYLANLPTAELDQLTDASSSYLSGWSHGKEALKTGQYDTLKGSFYVNCAFYSGHDLNQQPQTSARNHAGMLAPNLWPAEESLPGFKSALEDLCGLIVDTAILVAQTCDRYARTCVHDYKPNHLENVVKNSITTKARLLHYFPPKTSTTSNEVLGDHGSLAESLADDSWCATHIDHGCLTGLTSAMYIDEAAHSPCPRVEQGKGSLSPLPPLAGPPSSSTGLYIRGREGQVVKVSIPLDCLAFQTGEALEVITQGRLKAVPHFVKAERNSPGGMSVARNTLAIFTQPNLDEMIDSATGQTFGDLCKEVMQRFR